MVDGLWLGGGGFAVDSREAPLVVVTFPTEASTPQYELLFEHYAELCQKHSRIAWLIEFRGFDPVKAPASVRRQSAQIFARHRERLQRSTVCEARVVESTVSRGVLTAFDWLTGSKWPTRQFASFSEAAAWARKMLESDGRPERPQFPSFHRV
ncbi:MAG: hypothetical protein KC766_09405 [Myxococcales bacterium]|nr:hypothetical protein [Myxococcales bacterium]